MEAVFLNSSFKPLKIIDAFSSLIWTDRYCGYGDFELRLPMSDTAIIGINVGDYVSIRESERTMIVETIDISTSIEERYVTISGRSLESILTRRIIWEDSIITGKLEEGILRLLNTELMEAKNENRDVVQMFFVTSEDPEIEDLEVTAQFNAGDNLYDAIYNICASERLGFRILAQENGTMEFRLYKGIDRSYKQEKNAWVIFSPKFENIKSSEMNMDTTNLKTYVLARSDYTEQVKYISEMDGDGQNVKYDTRTEKRRIEVEVNGDLTGLERREIFYRSNQVPESVDIEKFGAPGDRVNKQAFCSYEPVYFRRDDYEADMKEFEERANALYVPAVKEHTESRLEWMKPGDPGYIPEIGGSVGQSHVVTYKVPGTTPEEYEKNNKAYNAYVQYHTPNKDDYMNYRWVLTDEEGYHNALDEARAAIEAEVAAARAQKVEITRGIMKTEAEAVLAENSNISRFEGDLDPHVQNLFGKDYYLGDLVQIVDEYGFQATTRVVAMMYSEEEGAGYMQSPTFESDDEAVFDI